uniref:Armadillo like helical domain containing 3 n=1 Tax=Nothoprocta perdicaria TaxID=30464 RepID=A0A8C6ZGX7_NOTPE
MINSIFEAILQILSSPLSRREHGYDAVVLLALLVNYRKYESVNPYIVKLSIVDDEPTLNPHCFVCLFVFRLFRQYKDKEEEHQSGFFSAITNMVMSLKEHEYHPEMGLMTAPTSPVPTTPVTPLGTTPPSSDDLMVEFIVTHMMKEFPMDLYVRCIQIVHKLLCYQKKCRVRLHYTWRELWSALINLLKFLMSNETVLLAKHNIFILALMVVNLFNMFITYGDTFLPTPSSYDELYYEIIRMHQNFDNLYSMVLRLSTNAGQWKEPASKVTHALVNIRAIINHFNPKIESYAAVNHISQLSEDQVLEVVRSNYDTLTLKLQDGLDQYERYSEQHKEAAFFKELVRSISINVRKNLAFNTLSQELLLKEFSTIS